jgi:hypothetical protein
MNTETVEQRTNRQVEMRHVSRHNQRVLRRLKKATSPRRRLATLPRSTSLIKGAARVATSTYLIEKATTPKARRRKRD